MFFISPRPSVWDKVAFFALLFCLLAGLGCTREDDSPRAAKGFLDLSGWDFAKNGPASLNGEWEFYWEDGIGSVPEAQALPEGPKDYFPIPALWRGKTANGVQLSEHGLATYHLRVRLQPNAGSQSLYIAGVLSVCRVWVNGSFLSSTGTVGSSLVTEIPRKHIIIPHFSPEGEFADIVLQVSNYHNIQGGVNSAIYLGTGEQVRDMASSRWVFGALIGGGLLVMSIFHLVLYFMRRLDRANLYFGLVCLSWSVGTFFSPSSGFLVSQLTSLPWQWNIDLAVLPSGLIIPFIVIFYHALFPKKYGRIVNWLYGIMGGIYILYICATPPNAYDSNLLVYFFITRTALLYLFAAFIVDIVGREKNVWFLVPGYLALLYSEFDDIFFDLNVFKTAEFAPYGVLIFILSYSLFMSARFSQAFANVERLSGELETNNERLLRLNMLKDEFLANSTHEMKTPLAGMIGIAENLMVGAGDQLPDGVISHLHMMVHSGKRLSKLIDDVLDHARLEHMDVHLNREPVSISETTKHVLALSRSLAEDKGIALDNLVGEGLPFVFADTGRVEQILFNLVGNAIKFSERGVVTVSAFVQDDVVRVCVADTGVGIAEKDIQAIFESYSQRAVQQSETPGGTGLGLAISKRLVELHGGVLQVESTEGEGSVFFFTLPLYRAVGSRVDEQVVLQTGIGISNHAYSPVPPQGAIAGEFTLGDATGSKYQVLVVDDEPVNLHVVTACLVLSGITFKTARSGTAALRLIEEGDTPSVILLDVMMPGPDGYTVCRELRKLHNASVLPVIMLTCKNRVEDIVAGFAAGANDYVTKPFSREELIARISMQIKLKESFEILEENSQLRREVVLRQKTEQELRLMQLRLSRMLDSIDDFILAVNQSHEIGFCNKAFETCTGYNAKDILGQPLATLLDEPEGETASVLFHGFSQVSSAGRQSFTVQGLGVRNVLGERLEYSVLVSGLELEDEILLVMILRPGDILPRADEAVRSVSMLRQLGSNRQRIQDVEEMVLSLNPGDEKTRNIILHDLKAIDTLLKSVSSHLNGDAAVPDRRSLAISVMNAAVECWTSGGRQTKADLAEQSGIWSVYTEKDGYHRTQTLDKYCCEETFPQRPRWQKINATAEFVLANTPPDLPACRELADRLARLKSLS